MFIQNRVIIASRARGTWWGNHPFGSYRARTCVTSSGIVISGVVDFVEPSGWSSSRGRDGGRVWLVEPIAGRLDCLGFVDDDGIGHDVIPVVVRSGHGRAPVPVKGLCLNTVPSTWPRYVPLLPLSCRHREQLTATVNGDRRAGIRHMKLPTMRFVLRQFTENSPSFPSPGGVGFVLIGSARAPSGRGRGVDRGRGGATPCTSLEGGRKGDRQRQSPAHPRSRRPTATRLPMRSG